MQNKKVVLDTNIWISLLINKELESLDNLFLNSNKLLYSEELIEEINSVITRPKFKKYFTNEHTKNMFSFISNYGILVDIDTDIKICRDSKDDFLLNLAIDGNADYLVTGDNDLLIIENIESTKIIRLNEFTQLF